MSGIPSGAKILAACLFTAIVALFFWLFDSHSTIGFGTAMGLAMATVAAAVTLLAGYVYADASKRGMPAVPWTVLALLVPNGVGFVLYFLLRKPILHPCSKCGQGVAPDSAYCPKCGESQMLHDSWRAPTGEAT